MWLRGNKEAQREVRGINTFGRNEAMRLYVLAERTGSTEGGEKWPTANHLYLSLKDDIYIQKLLSEREFLFRFKAQEQQKWVGML